MWSLHDNGRDMSVLVWGGEPVPAGSSRYWVARVPDLSTGLKRNPYGLDPASTDLMGVVWFC